MLSRIFRRGLLLLAPLTLCAALCPAGALAAPVGEGNDKPKVESPAEKVRKALDKAITLEIAGQPLPVALSQLREQTKVNFVIDRTALTQLGVDPDQLPITVKLRNVKARSALRTIAGQCNLGSVIIGDSVIVTQEDLAVVRQMRQRVSLDYDKVPVATVLKQLGKETATNLLLDSRLQKEGQLPVTLQIDDVPLDTAVRLIAEMAGLKPVRMGNVLFVTAKANATELRAEPELVPTTPASGDATPPVPFAVPGAGTGAMIGGRAMPAQTAPAMPPFVPPSDEVPLPLPNGADPGAPPMAVPTPAPAVPAPPPLDPRGKPVPPPLAPLPTPRPNQVG